MQVLVLGLWLLVIPILAGGIFVDSKEKRKAALPFGWISGQMLLWAAFQLLCVPLILKEKSFRLVVLLFQLGAFGLAVIGLVFWILHFRKARTGLQVVPGQEEKKGKFYYGMWGLFGALLLFQMVRAVTMTYADGDDAYYVAVSTLTEESDTMYVTLPYTGGTTGLDTRHGLAPFPIWIAFLSRVSGMRAVSVAHVAVPLILIPMTYGIFYLIGRKLCGRSRRERLPVFLVFTQLLVLFGDYSFYTAENFMIARSRQGKAALGNIIVPVLIYLLILLLEKVQEGLKVGWRFWGLLAGAVIAGCLCSTLGALLACMLVGVTGLCAAVCYKKWKILIPMALCCIPAAGFAFLYMFLE